MKLATRLTVLFLLLSIVPLAVVGYLAYDNGQRTIEQNTLNHLISTTILKEDEFDRWVEDSERSLRELARRPLIREYAALLVSQDPSTGRRGELVEPSGRDPADPEYQAAHRSILEDHLNPTLEEEGGFLTLSILRGDDGLILVSTDEKREGKYRESAPYFVEGRSRTYVQNVYYSKTLEEAAMAIGTPVKDKEGNMIAVLAGHVDLAEASEIMMQGSGLSASEETYLVNKFNFFVTESRFELGYALKKALHTDGVEACLGHNSFDLAQDRDGVGFYDDYRGVPVIGAYRWMPERELCILTEVNQAEAYAPIVALRKTVLRIGVGVALMVVLLGIFFARTITRPVRQLVRGAEEIGRGNLEYRIEVAARDEIGQLATAFNEMAAERKRAEEERERLLAELEAKNRELESFVYTVSHDLKAPLISLDGFSSVLQKEFHDQLGQQGQHYLERIQANVARMDALITDLLELSRIGRVVGTIEEVVVAALLREIQEELAVELEEAGAKFVVQEPLPAVRADRGRIRQVFVNLIDNAAKFRSEERPLRIEVGCQEEEGFYRFHVADNGIGIAPQYREQIFAPFQQLESGTEGVGMGLALVRKIVEHHGGRVWVESEAGEGATFCFTLPVSVEGGC